MCRYNDDPKNDGHELNPYETIMRVSEWVSVQYEVL